MHTVTITLPDDWHCHFRDGPYLKRTVIDTQNQFGRALIMPNLIPPVTNAMLAKQYRERIVTDLPAGSEFQPWMALYLTDSTTPDTINEAKASGIVLAAKLYPAGATTHSASGVTNIERIYPALETMQQLGMTLCVHGEVTDPAVDIFDREAVFIDRVLVGLQQRFPELNIVLEHITTQVATEFVLNSNAHLGATITAHHLWMNRNDLLVGGIKPHHYCLPILKRSRDQEALIIAATSGNPKFFLGTDSAPHTKETKEHACGCAGIYTAHAALGFYAEIFADANALDKLEGFASFYGADFYRLPRNTRKITLTQQPQNIPESLPFGPSTLVPFLAGQTLNWSMTNEKK